MATIAMHSPDGRPWIADTEFEAFELEAQGYTRDDGSTGSSGDGTVGRTLGAPAMRTFTDWRRHASGPLPDAGDEGTRWVINPSATIATLAVSGGGVMAQGLDADPGALYLNQELGAKVRRMGAIFGFGPGTAGSVIALCAWTDVEMEFIAAHIHLVVYPAGWQFDVWHTIGGVASSISVKSGSFATPLPTDYSELLTEVTVTGTTATILLPDRSVVTATHAEIGSTVGTASSFEWLQTASGQYPMRLYEQWADTQPDLPGAPSAVVAGRIAATQNLAPARTLVQATNTLRQVTTSPVAIGTVTCTVGESGVAIINVVCDQVEWATTGQYYLWTVTADEAVSVTATVIRGTTLTGRLSKEFKLSGLSRGRRTFTFQHSQFNLGSGATTGHGIRLDSTNAVECIITAQGGE